jgi:3-hydroxyacyl-CoA dehydrogenase/enoyl-CoA hydratase/3-hydroxybutyryl-CoA epimerase
MQNAFRLIDEGVKPETIDAAMEEFGMPMGPAELADTVGLDICLAAGKSLAKDATSIPKVLASNVEAGRLGKKTGQGIYRWQDGRAVKRPADAYGPDLVEKLISPYLTEAQRVVQEGIVDDADLADAGLIFGTGFAPFRGGPLHFLSSR